MITMKGTKITMMRYFKTDVILSDASWITGHEYMAKFSGNQIGESIFHSGGKFMDYATDSFSFSAFSANCSASMNCWMLPSRTAERL